MPLIHVRNDMYQPEPTPPPAPTAIHYQPAYQQDDYYPQEYSSPPAPIVQPSSPKPMVRARPKVKTVKPGAQHSMVSSSCMIYIL